MRDWTGWLRNVEFLFRGDENVLKLTVVIIAQNSVYIEYKKPLNCTL